jgi:hypothetical protein
MQNLLNKGLSWIGNKELEQKQSERVPFIVGSFSSLILLFKFTNLRLSLGQLSGSILAFEIMELRGFQEFADLTRKWVNALLKQLEV